MLNARQLLQNKSLCIKYFKAQNSVSKLNVAWKNLYFNNFRQHNWNVFLKFKQNNEDFTNTEKATLSYEVNEDTILSKFKLKKGVGEINLSILKESLSPYTQNPIEGQSLKLIDEEIKSERPSKSKILRYAKTKNYFEILNLKSKYNMNHTEYGYVLWNFLDKKAQYIIERILKGNSVDFQEIWKLLINPNSILSSKSSKSQTEENNQEKVEEENEAEEAGEIQTNLVNLEFTEKQSNMDIVFKFSKMIRLQTGVNKTVKEAILYQIAKGLIKHFKNSEKEQITGESFNFNKLQLNHLIELLNIMHVIDLKNVDEKFKNCIAKALLNLDFNILSTDTILNIVTFEPFKKDLMIQYDLKNKLLTNTSLNSNSVASGPSSFDFIKILCNLEMNSEADFSLIKKIFSDYSHQLMYRGNYFSDSEFHQLVETLCYLKSKQPLFFHFYKDEIPHILNIIKRKFDHNVRYNKDININMIAKITNTFSESLKRPDFLFNFIIDNKDSMQKIEERQLLLLIQLIKNRADEYFTFEHLTHSKKKRERNLAPFTFRTFGVIFKIKDDFLNSQTKLEEYQFLALCKLFGSDTLSTLMQKYVKTEEMSAFIKTINQYITVILGKDEFREKLSHFQLRYKVNMIDEILKSIKNIVQKYSTQISNTDYELIKGFQSILLQKINELIQKGVVPLGDLFSIYEQSIKISNYTNFTPTKFLKELSPLTQLIDSSVKCFLKYKPNLTLNLINDKDMDHQYKASIFKKNNPQFIAEQTSSILTYIDMISNETLKKSLFIEMIRFVGNHNVRTLKSDGIKNLFEIMEKYELRNKDILLNILPNIPTVIDESMETITSKGIDEINKRLTKYENYDFNTGLEDVKSEEERKIRKLILHSYQMLFRNFQDEFRKVEHNLNGLSKLIEPLFNELDRNSVVEILDILGKDNIENYHPDFMIRLMTFSNNLKYDEILKTDPEFLIELSKKWPRFVKNNALMSNLLKINRKIGIQDKRMLADICCEMLVFEPQVMKDYFEGLFLMKNKTQLAEYIDNFINKASLMGYTNFDIKRLVLALRVLNPDPREMNSQVILNFLVLLSSSSTYYKNFDAKSIEFVEKCLDIVEETYSGKKVAHIKTDDSAAPDKASTVRVEYYEKIPTSEKNYSKFQKADPDWLKSYKFLINDLSENNNDYKVVSQFEENVEEEKEAEEVALEEDLVPDEVVVHALDTQHQKSKDIELEDDGLKAELNEENIQNEEQKFQFTPNIGEPVQSNAGTEGFVLQVEPKKKEKKIYERKYREEIDPEDIKVTMQRRKKMQELNYQAKHLLLFSNVDLNDYTNLNLSDYAKAWGVLFNFRNKSLESPLYDEVENILARNSSGKRMSLKLFNVFHSEMLNVALKRNYHINYHPKCDLSGWPIDISVSKGREDSAKLGFIFLLQEDLGYDISKNSEFPLGMQKLMLNQLGNVSSFKIVTINENEFYDQIDKFDYIDRIISESFMKMEAK